MELMLLRPKEFDQWYSCNYTVPSELLQDHRILGSLYVSLALAFMIFYIPCLFAIARSELIKQSCYKIMFFIGVLDIVGLILSGLISGSFGIFQIHFCHSPRLFYFLGLMAESIWYCQTSSCLLLAINRGLVMTTHKNADILFRGYKTWLFILLPLSYGTFTFLFIHPVIFSPILMTWLFNPHFGVYPDTSNYFVSYLHPVNNFLVVATIPQVYFGFTILQFYQERKVSQPLQQKYNTVFYQVLLICTSTTVCSITFVLMQYFIFPTTVYHLVQIMWITYTGLPTVVYLTMNKNIRSIVFSSFCKHSFFKFSFGNSNSINPN